jgi:hypothetical protein
MMDGLEKRDFPVYVYVFYIQAKNLFHTKEINTLGDLIYIVVYL